MSVDALDADPRFQTATVNPPEDPLVRGACGPVQCQQVDFLTLQIAPDGTPWASFVDGCTADPRQPCPLPGAGIAGRLVGGPKLVGAEAAARAPGRCTPARRVVLHVGAPRGTRVRRVSVLVNGHRVRPRTRKGRISAIVDLRRRDGQTVTVRSRVTTRTGRHLRTTRHYRVCAR